MRLLRFGLTVITTLTCAVTSSAAFAATKCTYDAKNMKGSGCQENYKCSPEGTCVEAYTAAEVAELIKSPYTYPTPPPSRAKCEEEQAKEPAKEPAKWGMVGDSCLPSCEQYGRMYAEHLKALGIDPVKRGIPGCRTYLSLKDSCPRPPSVPGVGSAPWEQEKIPAYGVPQGQVCCLKQCLDYSRTPPQVDPAPYNYSGHILPLFAGDEEAKTSGPSLGAPTYPNGKPLPSGPERPFGKGPAPKKPR